MRPPWNWLLTDYGSHYTVVLWITKVYGQGQLDSGVKGATMAIGAGDWSNTGNAANIQIQSINPKTTGAVWKLSGPNSQAADTMTTCTIQNDYHASRPSLTS